MRNLNESDYRNRGKDSGPIGSAPIGSAPFYSGQREGKKRIPEEKIRAILAEYQQGTRVPELCWKYGITDRSFYRWKAKFGVKTYEKAVPA